jgi:hypothetical protein
LDLRLHIVDGVRRLHLKGDSLTREGLDEDLHFDEGLEEASASFAFLQLEKKKEAAEDRELMMLKRNAAYLDKLSSSTFCANRLGEKDTSSIKSCRK